MRTIRFHSPSLAKIAKITLTIDRPKLSADDIRRLQAVARAAGDGASVETTGAAVEANEAGPISSNIGLNIGQRLELRMDKMEACRKEADARGLSVAERLRFVRTCLQ